MNLWLNLFILSIAMPGTFFRAPEVEQISSIQIPTLFQPSLKPCYFQHGEVVNLVKQYAPVKLPALSYPYCLCEHLTLPEMPTQLGISTQNKDDAGLRCTHTKQINVEQCDSFDASDSCETTFTISAEADLNYEVMLECSSGTLETNSPESLIEIYGISDFDVGERCSGDDVAQEINSKRIELYRKNSQFYRRILISQSDINNVILNNCDPRLPTSPSFQLTLKFRCTNSIPSLDTKWHKYPAERTAPTNYQFLVECPGPKPYSSENSPYMTNGWPMCYLIRGPPRPEQFATEIDQEFETGTEVCVCEQQDHITLKKSQLHNFGSGKRVKGQQCRSSSHVREYSCADYQCQHNIYPSNDPGLDVVIGCKPDLESAGKTKPDDAYATNWGTKYYPKTTLKFRWVELGSTGYGKVKQIWLQSYCGTGERQLYDKLRDMINGMVVDRPNSELHQRVVFDPMTLADPFCPKNLTEKFLDEVVGHKYFWDIGVECK